MKLWKHQQAFLDKNPDIAILAWEGGLGKTLTAIMWANKRDWAELFIVVCPKAIREKWQNDIKKWGCAVPSMVITKEELKKLDITKLPSKLILVGDEAHHFASPLFIAKERSAMTEVMYNLIKRNSKMPRLMLSATVVRSSPANMHTLLYLTVKQIDWKKYRDYFYRLVQLPYLPRPAWMPKPKWQKEMPKLIGKYCDVALVKDCFDVPIHSEEEIQIELTPETKAKIKAIDNQEWDAVKLWHAKNRLENGLEKLAWIKEYAETRAKVVIICKYKEQIETYAKELSKSRLTFVVTGDTKDQFGTIQEAQDSAECFILIQSQVTAGYDLDKFSSMIFASYDWSSVNFLQAHWRVERGHNLHRNEYRYLVAGEKDQSVLDSLKLKEDFEISKVKREDI